MVTKGVRTEMSDKTKVYNKYLVIKRERIQSFPKDLQDTLKQIEALLETPNLHGREFIAPNEYWVVNKDESYADEVRKLIFGETRPSAPSSAKATEDRQWVPVSERLPEEGVIVVIACERSSLEQFTDVGVILNGNWHYAYTNHRIRADGGVTVTRWMPLPEPPKEPSDG